MEYNQDTCVLTLNEYELHEILCNLTNQVVNNSHEHVERIVLEVKDPDKITEVFLGEQQFTDAEVFRAKWERKVNKLFALMAEADIEYHNDAGHTC